ncbi:hypothetical protein Bca4012_013018 [Brassica carinata]
MGDEAEERFGWKLKVGMRMGRFKLKLHLRNRLIASWKLHRLSFVVRFRKHHLRIDSESKPECARKSRFGFIRSFGALRRRRVVVEKVGPKMKMGIWNGFSAMGVVATLIILILYYFLLTK